LSKVPVSEPDATFGDEEGAVGRKVRVLERGMLLGDFRLATHQALMTRKFSTTNRAAVQAACYRSEGERLNLNGDYSLRFRVSDFAELPAAPIQLEHDSTTVSARRTCFWAGPDSGGIVPRTREFGN
jgi:hypothetical protein